METVTKVSVAPIGKQFEQVSSGIIWFGFGFACEVQLLCRYLGALMVDMIIPYHWKTFTIDYSKE